MKRVKNGVVKLSAIVLLQSGLAVIMMCALYAHFLVNPERKAAANTDKNVIQHIDNPEDGDGHEDEDGNGDGDAQIIKGIEQDILIPSLSFYYNKLNIIVEEFKVMTSDGYPLILWHLKDTRRSTTQSQSRKPMLFMHGLLQSSASFASSGDKSLAYYFNEQGYDIWLGNNRIGFDYDCDKNKHDENYWNWDMNEMYRIDLPTLITFVQEKTGYSKIHLVGHSQGTTQIFLSLINNTDNIKSKIDKFIALAPACYPGPLLTQESRIFKIIRKTIDNPWVFGKKSFIKIMMLTRYWFLGTEFFGFICYLFFSYVFEWDNKLWDKKMTARHFMFSPVYVSVKLMQWWLSDDINKVSFIQHSSSLLFPEDKTWFQGSDKAKGNGEGNGKGKDDECPEILMVVPRRDKLVDGIRLIDHFNKYENPSKFKYWIIDKYSHLDVLWATDVLETVGEPLAKELEKEASD